MLIHLDLPGGDLPSTGMAARLPDHLREIRQFKLDRRKWRDVQHLESVFTPLSRVLQAKLEKHHPTSANATGKRLTAATHWELAQALDGWVLAADALVRETNAAAEGLTADDSAGIYADAEELWVAIDDAAKQGR